jgi:hypothetical protein
VRQQVAFGEMQIRPAHAAHRNPDQEFARSG